MRKAQSTMLRMSIRRKMRSGPFLFSEEGTENLSSNTLSSPFWFSIQDYHIFIYIKSAL